MLVPVSGPSPLNAPSLEDGLMFELFVEGHFSAAHRLDRYPGNCARWHGHNWQVTVYAETQELNDLGMAVDFRTLKRSLADTLDRFDHRDLNEVAELEGSNPTCEVIARFLFRELTRLVNDGRVRVSRVRVSETPNAGVIYSE